MKSRLRIFIAQHCPGCTEAITIADNVRMNFAHAFNVEIVDIADEQADVPERIFATPTYMLDDRIVSLGNPGPKDIAAWAESTKIEVSVGQNNGCRC